MSVALWVRHVLSIFSLNMRKQYSSRELLRKLLHREEKFTIAINFESNQVTFPSICILSSK